MQHKLLTSTTGPSSLLYTVVCNETNAYKNEDNAQGTTHDNRNLISKSFCRGAREKWDRGGPGRRGIEGGKREVRSRGGKGEGGLRAGKGEVGSRGAREKGD